MTIRYPKYQFFSVGALSIAMMLWASVAKAATIEFVRIISAEYTFTESATITNPAGKSVSDKFMDETLTRTPLQMGLAESPADPDFGGQLGHSHGNNKLFLDAFRSVRNGTLANAQGLPSGSATIDVEAQFRVNDAVGDFFRIEERDILSGAFATTVDLGQNGSRSIANVDFSTIKNQRGYNQSLTVQAGNLNKAIQRIVEKPEPRTVTNITQNTSDFTITSTVVGRVHFTSDFEFLTTVAGNVPFTVLGTLNADVLADGINAESHSDFGFLFSPGLTIELKATQVSVPEPATPALIVLGLACLVSQRIRRLLV